MRCMDNDDRVMFAEMVGNFCMRFVDSILDNDQEMSDNLLSEFHNTMCGLMEASYVDGMEHANRISSRSRVPSMN